MVYPNTTTRKENTKEKHDIPQVLDNVLLGVQVIHVFPSNCHSFSLNNNSDLVLTLRHFTQLLGLSGLKPHFKLIGPHRGQRGDKHI